MATTTTIPAVPLSCTPALVVPVAATVAAGSGMGPFRDLLTFREAFRESIVPGKSVGREAAETYLGILFALRKALRTPMALQLEWRRSSNNNTASVVIAKSLDEEIVLTLAALASMEGTRADRDATTTKTLASATKSYEACAMVHELLAAFLGKCGSNNNFTSRVDCQARAALMHLLAAQCTWAASLYDLTQGLALVVKYEQLARLYAALPWAVTFAKGHAHLWLMHCADLAYHDALKTDGKKFPSVTDLLRREQLLSLAISSAKKTMVLLESQPSITDLCGAVYRRAKGDCTHVREERFRNATLRDEKTPIDIDEKNRKKKTTKTTADDDDDDALDIRLDLFGVSLEAPPSASPTRWDQSTLWLRITTEAQSWITRQGGAEAVNKAFLTLSSPPALRDSLPPVAPYTSEMLFGGREHALTVREQALGMLAMFVERERALRMDPFAHEVELQDVLQGMELARKLLSMNKLVS